MDKPINFDQLLQKNTKNLITLQQRLQEMRREYEMYQRVVEQMKRAVTGKPTTSLCEENLRVTQITDTSA